MAEQITIPVVDIEAYLVYLFEGHGCTLGLGTITFPVGTVRRPARYGFVTANTEWIDYILPDAFVVPSKVDKKQEKTLLYIPVPLDAMNALDRHIHALRMKVAEAYPAGISGDLADGRQIVMRKKEEKGMECEVFKGGELEDQWTGMHLDEIIIRGSREHGTRLMDISLDGWKLHTP